MTFLQNGSPWLVLVVALSACDPAAGSTPAASPTPAWTAKACVTSVPLQATSVRMHSVKCRAGEPQSCVMVGAVLQLQNEECAAALYTKACDQGEPSGCSRLGNLMEHGWGVSKDEARAF